jgi:class 3 adenylate cyclase
MVEAGDLLAAGDLVQRAGAPLADAADRGAVVVLGWPALVPRLQATVARHAGAHDDARRHLLHAVRVAERHGLHPELGRARIELAVLAGATGAASEEIASHLVDALRTFDRLGLHRWSLRCDEVAASLDVTALLGAAVAVRERTFLTTDIVGSTSTNARLGDLLYAEQMRTHDRIVRACLAAWRGLETAHTGDGMNACFDHASDAVGCALAIQDGLAAWRDAEPDLALVARCGIATGKVIPAGGNLFGIVQSETARLCAQAEAGQVLASSSTIDRLDGSGLRITPLGELHLRGLPEPTRVFGITDGRGAVG